MDANSINRVPAESRPPNSGSDSSVSSQPQPPIRPLNRVDSRSAFPPQSSRPVAPQSQVRPQFQTGGPVTLPSQFAPRVGAPPPRPAPPTPLGAQQIRPNSATLRPLGPQSIAPQQGPRPAQLPANQLLQRPPPPNNLQFGPRQPPTGTVVTPNGTKAQIQQPNGTNKNGPGPVSRQSSQGSLKGFDSSSSLQTKPVNLDNQSVAGDNQNDNKSENGVEGPGVAKGRSYSIAAAPGAPSPLKPDDDRRKSVSAIGSRIDDFTSRSPGLSLIQESKIDSKESIRESKESIRSDISNERERNAPDREESRLASSGMTESFIGVLPSTTPVPKKKLDDDDDVVLQNNLSSGKSVSDTPKPKEEFSDRSPSLTRSDDSPEPKPKQPPSSAIPNKSTGATSEAQRPKTPKVEPKFETGLNNKESNPVVTPNKILPPKSPVIDTKPPTPVQNKPNELSTPPAASDVKKITQRKTASAPKSRPKDGDNDSGVDESTQGNDVNGSPGSPNKKIPSKLPMKEKSSNSIKTSLSRSSSKSATAKTPENPPVTEKKKVPMNKIQVGNAPSPNIKTVKSKIGSLGNATYKPGGGKVKIENRKLEFGNITPKIAAKNDAYTPSGGAKKIVTTKLEWNAKSKIGSLQNAAYKPGGGDKKIETVKLDFKDKAKPKVASTVNITHKPGGGGVKIENQKLDFKAQSKVGSLDNVKHKPGGGDIKIFDDKDYIKQLSGQSPVPDSQGHSRQEDHYYMSVHEWTEEDRPKSRCFSARAPRTPRTLSPCRKVHAMEKEDIIVQRNNERNRRKSIARPMSARETQLSACSRRTSLTQRPAFSIY